MNKKFKDPRMSSLETGKVKGIGMFEKLGLKIAGTIDGARGLPRDDGNGQWQSPHLSRELHSYDEFCAKIWGRRQIAREKDYARLGSLMVFIVRTEAQHALASVELQDRADERAESSRSRRSGESKVSDDVIASRRARERDILLAPFAGKVANLQSQLDSATGQFSDLRSELIEDNNAVRMICTRVKNHVMQRIDVYWNAAMRRHPDKVKMPAVPSVELTSDAEEAYLEPHKEMMEMADMLSRKLSSQKKEE